MSERIARDTGATPPREAIADTVREVIAHASGADDASIRGDADLLEDLMMDSLAVFEVAVDLEAAYDLEISDEAIEHLRTPDEIVAFIEQRVKTWPSS